MNARLLGVFLLVVFLTHVSEYVPCLQDDAFISFRYAKNLVEGHGLVFNPGERVEGYTNFLWTLCMAIPLALGFSVETFSIALGVLGALLVVGLTWKLSAQRTGSAVGLACVPVLMLALDAPLVLEATQGLETSFFAFFTLAMVGTTLHEAEHPTARPYSALFGALAALTRPEGVLVYGITQGIRLLHERRLPAVRQRLGWGLVGSVVLGQLAFRLAYYGQPLPNTFYAKVGGGAETWLRGLDYLWRFVCSHKVFVLLTNSGGLMLLIRENRALRTWMLIGTALLWEIYVVSVGGDFKVTWRFMQPMMPLYASLVLDGLLLLNRRLPTLALGAGALLLWGGLDGWPEYERSRQEARFRADVTEMRTRVGRWLGQNASPGTVLAIHSAGTIPYYAGLPTIDMWGLADPHIARREMPNMGQGMAGHEKSDPAYVFSREPTLYLPEEFLYTKSAMQLPVPSDFPGEFEYLYQAASVPVGDGWFNFFERVAP